MGRFYLSINAYAILATYECTGIEGCTPAANLRFFWHGGHWLFTLDHDHDPAHLTHMKLGLLTDSTCDLPKYLIEQYELEVVPSILILDGKEYEIGRAHV